MKDGQTLWYALCHKYEEGVLTTEKMQETWKAMEPYVDKERFNRIAERLSIQKNDAVWWKDACLLYFQTFSKMKLPKGIRKPEHKLKDLMKMKLPISNYERPTKDMLP